MMFRQITIVGMGHIGSSLARGISQQGLCEKLIAVDSDEDVRKAVDTLGLVDEITESAAQGVQNSDLVILCIPTGAIGKLVEVIGPFLKQGAILSDVSSVKSSVIKAVQPFLPDSVTFVPAHPIAGTEHSGPESGFSELFHDRWCIITPTPETPVKSVESVTKFWESCGARIEIMEPEHHDLVFGITSHLPHLIAYTIVGTATELEDDIQSEVIKFAASGFRGFTRIAASDPVMWRDIFLNNREAVLEALQRFSEDLAAMQKAIRRGDSDFLFDKLSKTRQIRREVMKLGPEGYPNPNQMRSKDSED